jgi:hypothetical protein
MDDCSRDLAISDNEIKALNFTSEDIRLIERTLLASASAMQARKVAMVIGITIGKLKESDSVRWSNLPDSYCAYLIRSLVFQGKMIGYGDLYRMRYSEIKLPAVDIDLQSK